MKKFFIAALFALSIVSTAFASDELRISRRAVAHLEANYASAKNISWTITDNFEKASFTIGNEKREVYFDSYGELVGSSKVMAYDKLPKAALDIFSTEYTFPDYQLSDCIEFTDAENNTNYFVSFIINEERVVLEVSSNGAVTQI